MREDVRNIKTICPSCFATLGGDGVCRACGKNSATLFNRPPALPLLYITGSRYLIGEVLGTGGFGITYLAWDLNESRKVAVKEFYPKEFAVREDDGARVGSPTPESVAQFNHWLRAFVEEAKILMRVKHIGGVIKLSDYFESNNTAYIVTDYLEGESLRSYLTARDYKVSWDTAAKIMSPILESMSLLHGYGVIHTDISPENIQIVQNKYVKLMDFGAATLYKVTRTEKPYTVLKAGYSPIELYNRTEYTQGPWTDVYQLGATLYNCVTGYIPAAAPERLKEDKLPLPSALGADIPEYAENALMKALAVLPCDRQQTVDRLISELKM